MSVSIQAAPIYLLSNFYIAWQLAILVYRCRVLTAYDNQFSLFVYSAMPCFALVTKSLLFFQAV